MFSIKSIPSYGHIFCIAQLGLGPKSKQHPQTLHPRLWRDKNIHQEAGLAPAGREGGCTDGSSLSIDCFLSGFTLSGGGIPKWVNLNDPEDICGDYKATSEVAILRNFLF